MPTPIPAVARWIPNARVKAFDPHSLHRRRILYTLDKLPHVTGRGPRLVFAHILSPHPPFVFGPEGEPVTPSHPFSKHEYKNWRNYEAGYRGQVEYLSRRARGVVGGILENSETTPVIVIMGDHQPPVITEHASNYDVPMHLFTKDPKLLEEFLAQGFVPSLIIPQAQNHTLKHEVFFRFWCEHSFITMEPPSDLLTARTVPNLHKIDHRSKR